MIDSKEILMMMEALSAERGITKEAVAMALEASLAAAVSRQLNIAHSGQEGIIKVDINRATGSFVMLKLKPREGIVVEEPGEVRQLPEADLEIEELPPVVFDRVAIQAAKQLIMQKVREAEREQLVEDYMPSLNKLVSGVVKRITRNKDIIVILNERVEAVLPADQCLSQDNYEIDDSINAVLTELDATKSTNQIFLSRTADVMVRELLVREVPEIEQQIVEICAIARIPGTRSKVAIRPKDHRIDAMSACIGMQGRRVQAVQSELGGEKIDILKWNDKPEILVRNVLSNPSILTVNINPAIHTIDVSVPPENIGEVLGKSGQNIRLASELIGWEINVMKEEEAQEKHSQAMSQLKNSFIEILDADEELVSDLLRGGFNSIQQLAYSPTDKFLRIEGFDDELAREIRNRAREHLLYSALQDKGGSPVS